MYVNMCVNSSCHIHTIECINKAKPSQMECSTTIAKCVHNIAF